MDKWKSLHLSQFSLDCENDKLDTRLFLEMHLLDFFCRIVHQLAKPSKPQLDFAFIWRCQIFLQFSTILCEIPLERMHYFNKKCPMLAKMMIGSIQLMRWKKQVSLSLTDRDGRWKLLPDKTRWFFTGLVVSDISPQNGDRYKSLHFITVIALHLFFP